MKIKWPKWPPNWLKTRRRLEAETEYLLGRTAGLVAALVFCAEHDRSKLPQMNQAINGKMPPNGKRFLTPKERASLALQEFKAGK